LKVWAKNKNKNLMDIAKKIKNKAKEILGGDHMTKI
jgi:hypothetical protein